MIDRPFGQIKKEHIESLVSNGVAEGRTLDYKQELPDNNDESKKEFLADVSSFANAGGGDLAFGIKKRRDAAKKPTGIPEAANGLAGINVEAEIKRLDSIIRDGLDPRIPGVAIRAIDGFTEGPMILVRVPRSWASPHMVKFKGSSRFFSRDNRGKYQLDVREIRSAFALSENVADRLRRFRDDRLAKVIAGETPALDSLPSKAVLHIVPISALEPAGQIDVSQDALAASSKWLWPMSTSGMSHRFNFDGLLLFAGSPSGDEKTHTYVQVFRSGTIEAVVAYSHSTAIERKILPSPSLELMLIDAVHRYLRAEIDFGVQPPAFVMLTLFGAKGFEIRLRDEWPDRYYAIDRDVLVLPEVLVESFDADGAAVLRPVLNALWQASGRASCVHYDESGKWAVRQ